METTTRYENICYQCPERDLPKTIQWANENGYELVTVIRDHLYRTPTSESCPMWFFFKRPIVSVVPPTLTEPLTPVPLGQ
jgi:hypothetical protein